MVEKDDVDPLDVEESEMRDDTSQVSSQQSFHDSIMMEAYAGGTENAEAPDPVDVPLKGKGMCPIFVNSGSEGLVTRESLVLKGEGKLHDERDKMAGVVERVDLRCVPKCDDPCLASTSLSLSKTVKSDETADFDKTYNNDR